MPNLSATNKADQNLRDGETSRSLDRRKKCPVLFPLQYRNRPPMIRAAIRLAADEGIRKGLPESSISVLQAIIACGFDQDNPGDSIFAKKTTLAKVAKVGEATVYRALKILGDTGFICRRIQDRQEDGTMDLSLINLSSNFLRLIKSIYCQLGSEGGIPSETNKDMPRSSPEISMAEMQAECPKGSSDTRHEHGVIDGLIDGPYIEVNDRCTQTLSVCNQSTGHKIEEITWKGKRFKLPVGLVWLWKEKGLQPTGIVKLMAMNFKLNGRRDLEQLVELRKTNIQQLNSVNSCYRYIESLVKASIDAAFQLLREKRKAIAAKKAQEISAEKEACRSWASSRAGQIFTAKDSGGKTFEVSGVSCRLVVGQNGNPSSAPTLQLTRSFIDAVERGTFKIYQRAPIEKGGEQVLNTIANALKVLKGSGSDRYGVQYGR